MHQGGNHVREKEKGMKGHHHNISTTYERHEIKYIVNEHLAVRVASFCREHLPRDPFCRQRGTYEYPILSIYLDSPGRDFLRDTIEGAPIRSKLRVRTYRGTQRPANGHAAFFEIKSRHHGVVRKTRAMVPPDRVRELLNLRRPLIGSPVALEQHAQENVCAFLDVQRRYDARPLLGVLYRREAYEDTSGERLRITLDRDLHCGALLSPNDFEPQLWWPVNPGGVILEIKFTGTYPFWVADMLHRLDMTRRGVCKYALCSRAADTVPALHGVMGRTEHDGHSAAAV